MDLCHKLVRSTTAVALALAVLAGLWAIVCLAQGHTSMTREPEAALALPDVDITIDDVIVSGFNRPIQVTHAGDGSDRLFVVEQTGRIWIVRNGAVSPTPFLDLSGLVVCCGERGLLGLAFHPDYGNNGHLYVDYTRSGDGATVIARYTVSADPDLADPTSASILLTIAQPYTNHNGGQLLFGPDGYLYIGMGDGGSGGDPHNHGQNPDTLLGAMLRIDVDGGSPYGIPPDNPYVGTGGADQIWAIGLRNPWRFSFDRATGDLYIGDVGQNQWEEISTQATGTPGGVNFGWRCREGTHTYNSAPPCDDPAHLATLTDPIAEYSHSEGRSVTGGFVYRGQRYPTLVGRYFYADYVEGKIWSLYQTGADPDTWSAPALELDTGLNISAFGEDEAGELYVVGYSDGTVRRLADVRGPGPDLSSSQKRSSSPNADPGDVVTYTVLLHNTSGPSDHTAFLTDTIPAGLGYIAGSLTATQGTVDETQNPVLRWHGILSPTPQITVTYRVTPTGLVTGSIINRAHLAGPAIPPITLTHALLVPRSVFTTTHASFFLPGTQPGQLQAEIAPPADCDICHSAPVYDRWRGSLMSQAGRDPLMWAALAVANNDAPDAGDYCLRCHTPKGWLEGRSHPADGSALQAGDVDAGVTCALCHRMVDPQPSQTDEATVIDALVRAALTSTVPISPPGSGMTIVDPLDNRRGPFSLGPSFPYHTAYRTDFLGQSAAAVTESRLCGTCHNVHNPALAWDEARGQFWPHSTPISGTAPFEEVSLFPIETTFDEWVNSAYATTGVYAPRFAGEKPGGIVRSCQDCHLRRTTGRAADEAFNPVERDCLTTGCLPEHGFVGGNTWVGQIVQDGRWRLHSPASQAEGLDDTGARAHQMLRQAATLTVTLSPSGTLILSPTLMLSVTHQVATVRVANESGHKLPTGYPEGRRMWINLRAYDGDGNLVYESGAYDGASGTLTQDADARVYEVKQGITPELAGLLEQAPGKSFHFVLNNTVVKDNRIPPRGYTQSSFDRPGLRPIGASYADGQYWDETTYRLPAKTTRVMATLYYQTASREYVDFLRAGGGVDGDTLGRLWEGSKSPPVVMARAWFPGYAVYLPVIVR
jgi:uncharacterized repeat protein (TIGR01451 family)